MARVDSLEREARTQALNPKQRPFARRSGVILLGLSCLLSARQADAADNFIQLYIAAKGGCGGPVSPLTFILAGPEIRAPFGKSAADWNDDDLTSLKAVLAACQATSARRGNLYNLNEIKRDSDNLLERIPDIVGQAKDNVRTEEQQIEARRQLATARIDKAAQARQEAKASAEIEVARLENEASMAEAKARDAQTRANSQIEQAGRARDDAKAKADALADLERRAQEDAGTLPRARRAAPGELSELEDKTNEPSLGKSSGPVTVLTFVDTMACNSIEAVAAADGQIPHAQDKADPTPSRACLTVAKGTRAIVQAEGTGAGLKALCVVLERHADCLWMAKAAFGPVGPQ